MRSRRGVIHGRASAGVNRTAGNDRAPQHFGRLLAAVCIAQATAILGFDFALPFMPLYLQHDLGIDGLGATAIWAGIVGFGPAIPATLLGPVWGRLADSYGYRSMLLRAMACAAILLAVMGLAPSVWILLVMRMVQGGLSGTVYSAQALVATAAVEEDAGRAMGLLQMSVYVGATLGPVAGGAVASAFSYRASFVGAGLLLALATVIVFFAVQEPRRRTDQPRHLGSRQPSLRSLMAAPVFAGAVLFTVSAQLAASSQFPVLPLYVEQLLHGAGSAATATGWMLALAGIAGAAGSYLAGRLHRRFGLTRPLALALVGCVLLLAPQAFVGAYLPFLILRALAAVAFGGLFALIGVWAAVASPARSKGAAFGLIGAASSLGFGAGPLLGGGITALAGIRPLFVMAAALLTLVGIAGLAVRLTLGDRLLVSGRGAVAGPRESSAAGE